MKVHSNALTWEGEAPAELRWIKSCGREARQEARPPEFLGDVQAMSFEKREGARVAPFEFIN